LQNPLKEFHIVIMITVRYDMARTLSEQFWYYKGIKKKQVISETRTLTTNQLEVVMQKSSPVKQMLGLTMQYGGLTEIT
jgi:hypothetical protein